VAIYYYFTATFVTDKILKIGQYLAN